MTCRDCFFYSPLDSGGKCMRDDSGRYMVEAKDAKCAGFKEKEGTTGKH